MIALTQMEKPEEHFISAPLLPQWRSSVGLGATLFWDMDEFAQRTRANCGRLHVSRLDKGPRSFSIGSLGMGLKITHQLNLYKVEHLGPSNHNSQPPATKLPYNRKTSLQS